jgi:hypothetical protein
MRLPSIRNVATVAMLSLTLGTLACDPLAPLFPPEPTGEEECGVAPETFDAFGDVVQGAGDEGCVRIERRAIDGDPALGFEPLRLVVHVDGFSRRYDVDTSDTAALAYEASADGTDTITATTDDNVKVRLTFDVCTGAWALNVDDGEAQLPVVGAP